MATSSARHSSKKHPLPHPHSRPHIRPVSSHKRTHSSKGSLHKSGHTTPKDDEEDSLMATSFLQFCATCEKQIITPSNNILYCSERCRRSDQKSSYISYEYSPPPTPYLVSSFDEPDLPAPKEPVPPRSPTAPSNRSSIAMSEASEEDPCTTPSRTPLSRENSEAARYLRQFQSTHHTRHSIDASYHPSARAPSMPSLSHTPASTPSMSLPYTPAPSYTRPLPKRHNPSTSFGARTVDLVTPCTTFPTTAPSSLSRYSFKTAPVATTTPVTVEGGDEVRYEKLAMTGTPAAPGSLGRLLGGGR